MQRLLARLTTAEIISVERIGNQKRYRANQSSPIFRELQSITEKTFVLAERLIRASGLHKTKIDVAFIYGPVASKTDTGRSDVDMILLSDKLTYADILEILVPLEDSLGRTFSPRS